MKGCRGAVLLAVLLASSTASAEVLLSGADPDSSLTYFVGTWDVRLTFRLPGGSEGEGRAAREAIWIMDGAFLQQEYTSEFRGQRLIIRQTLGYDDRRGKFVQFQLHEGGGAPTQTRQLVGLLSEDGTVLTLAGDSFDSFTGKPLKLRTVTRVVDEDHFIVEEWFRKPGERDELLVVLHHSRKGRCQPVAARCKGRVREAGEARGGHLSAGLVPAPRSGKG